MAIVSFLWHKYPWEKEPLKHLLIEIPSIIGYTVIFGFLIYQFINKYSELEIESQSIGMNIFNTILITLLITSVHEAYFFYIQWKHNFSKSISLEKENIHTQYEVLKSQINPHFLFN